MIYTEDTINEFNEESRLKYPENRKFFDRIKNKKLKNLDQAFHPVHDQIFDQVDCLKCANCCKTTSPIFSDIDIDRIAKHLRIRPSELVKQHLHLDSDGDYVLNSSPCTFLGSDNYCSIYDYRPKSCREYPHTDRKNIASILPLTLENTKVCPAVFEIVEQLKSAGLGK
ncbi:MAG: YkgJ family cysteine cluster protein [Bacteroidota bacterium]|jgi:Fe-S-cluster containining protein